MSHVPLVSLLLRQMPSSRLLKSLMAQAVPLEAQAVPFEERFQALSGRYP